MKVQRKNPKPIEAFQWTGGPDQMEDPEWIVQALVDGRARMENPGTPNVTLWITSKSDDGEACEVDAQPGDYILLENDELFVTTQRAFKVFYEEIK